MSLGDCLLACHHTLSGADARSWARHDFTDRVAAAASAGFSAIGLMWLDYEHLLAAGTSAQQLRNVVDDHGVEVVEVEFLNDWWREPDAAVREHERLVLEMADVFGARHLNIGASVTVEEAPSQVELAERLAALCERAAGHDLLVGLEPMPFFVVSDVTCAWELVQRSGAPNAGLVVDAYHWMRGGADLDALRAVPGERVVAVQLCDGPATPTMPLLTETLDHRLWPGEGDFPLRQLLGVLSEMGVDAPVGVEVLSAAARSGTASELAKRAAASLKETLG